MRRFILILCVVMATMAVPTASNADSPPPNPACDLHGTELPPPGFWTAVWNFDGPEFCLIATSLPDQPNLPAETTYQIVSCTEHGTIDWEDGYASFSGKSYLACPFNLPNSAQTTDYQHFWMFAQTQLSIEAGMENPIFYHPDLRLNQARYAGVSWLDWRFRRSTGALVSGNSDRFFPGTNDHLRAETCLAGALHCSSGEQSTYPQFATINGLQSFSSAANAPVRLSNTGTIFIGYNPETQGYFQGLLGMIVIDPPYGKDPEPDALPPFPQ